MQLYKEVLLSQDRHRELVQAVEDDRLVRRAGQRTGSLRTVGQRLVRFIGMYLSF